MKVFLRKNYHFYLISLYTLSYLILRITASPYLDWDEAEQYLAAQNFNLGDAQQPPLYSWLSRLVLLISNGSPYSLMSLRYLFLLLFIHYLYLAAKQFFPPQKAFTLCTLVLALIPSYAYTINFKLTHSVLVFALSSACFYYYLLALKENKSLSFLKLGLVVGLGLIAKYNFIFLLSALILASLTLKHTRKAFLKSKLLISITVSLLIASPHYLWLLKHSTKAANYLSERGHFKIAQAEDYNYLINIFKLSFSAFSQLFIFIIFLGVIYLVSKFKAKALGLKYQINEQKKDLKLLAWISFFSYLVPVSIFLICKSEKLISGWLSVSHFITAIYLYLLLEQFAKKRYYSLSRRLAYIIILVLFLIKYLWIFQADLFEKKNTININYKVISKSIEQSLGEAYLLKNTLICEDKMIYVNLKILNKEWNLDYFKDNKEKKELIQNYNFKKLEIPYSFLHSHNIQNKNKTLKFFISEKINNHKNG